MSLTSKSTGLPSCSAEPAASKSLLLRVEAMLLSAHP